MTLSPRSKMERDRRLRKAILDTLSLSRYSAPTGRLRGETVVKTVHGGGPFDDQIENDQHAMLLLRSLVFGGYVDEEITTPLRVGESVVRPRNATYRINDKGLQLVNEQLPIDPLVEDGRLREDEL